MICCYCSGTGYIHNPKVDSMSDMDAYERDIPFRIKCRACGGSGFIIGNANEAIEMLNVHLNNGQPLTIREIKQLKTILIK